MMSDHSSDPSGSSGSSGSRGATPSSGQTSPADGYCRIEQVAARTGLTKRTLRYYEEIGLLPPPTRTEGGYRLYSEQDIAHLELIKRLRDLLGFSLAEIRELADAEEERQVLRAGFAQETNPAARLTRLQRANELTERQLRLVDEKLAGLREMRADLQARLDRYVGIRAELEAKLAEGAGSAGTTNGTTNGGVDASDDTSTPPASPASEA